MVIGDWKGTAFELPAGERAMAGAVACLARRYSNPESRRFRLGPAARRPPRKNLHAYARCLLPGRRLHLGRPLSPSSAATAPTNIRRNSGRPWQPGRDESVRLADLLELERLERVVGARRASLEICAGAGALQTLRHPGDRGSGRRSRRRSLQRLLECFPARARQARVFRPQARSSANDRAIERRRSPRRTTESRRSAQCTRWMRCPTRTALTWIR